MQCTTTIHSWTQDWHASHFHAMAARRLCNCVRVLCTDLFIHLASFQMTAALALS